ncbi:hypothetical protein A2115_01860 [Candidatus Woesebacteria bacterium GWA1_41_8]|jgi:adenylate kinase|uniref:Adenylate kinase n=1 Tax=Candidatus Woesebacteria bacterium GWA1_41_8 TaxID=1802471 RepID=A0A1F7WIX6_9BACT|nr:MAG: hypothetical protein A2115_01860 [Candidatus Woesebacteria bacterium GWA1_41_8]
MILVISGPQASGKGTQGDLLAKKLGLFHMESGEMLREIAKTDNRIRDMLNTGTLVPGEETIKLMEKKINDETGGLENIIFDGFPRTPEQYELFKKWLQINNTKLDCTIYLEISDKEAEKRLSARRIDEITGEVYNLITNPPGTDVNPEYLVQREDDKPAAIRKRLFIFHSTTKPMLEEMEKDGLLVKVNGEQSIMAIFEEILTELKKRGLYNG